MTQQALTSYALACIAANIAEDKKAADVVLMETATVSHLADYFVLASGESAAQIRTTAEAIDEALTRLGERCLHKERDASGQWYLLDYGAVVVHVMHRHAREFYQLEKFWSHADVIPPAQWRNQLQQAS